MAPKLVRTKGDSKGKGKASTSSTVPETPFSLVSSMCVKEFEGENKHHLVVKKYVWKLVMDGCLDIPYVVSLVEHQQINYFLKLSHNYNEDLIRVFNYWLHNRRGSSFKFTIGNTVYEFTDDLWKSLFGITIVDVDVEMLVTDINLHQHFKWNIHLNQLLKASRSDDCYDPITAGQLKIVPRILLWVVSHMLRPKNGGFSRINNVKIHLVYDLLNKININWANHHVS